MTDRFSRRDFLGAALGASVAASACRGRKPRLEFSGKLLGQNAERGHAMRDGLGLPVSAEEHVPVVIIGGGAAGLSAAWQLERSGFHDYRVYELEDRAGGTAISGENAVSAYPWGAHYVPVPLAQSTALITLLREMDVVERMEEDGRPVIREELLCRAPQERLFHAGRWQEGLYPRFGASAEDLRQLAAFDAEVDRWVSFRDEQGRRAFSLPTARGAAHPELDALDAISMEELLRKRGWTSPRLRWWIEYGCRDDYGCTLATTSAFAGMFYFAARMDRPHGQAAEFITWPEGNGKIIQHLARRAGPRVVAGKVALGVAQDARSVRVRVWDPVRKSVTQVSADQCVLATPNHVSRHLFPGLHAVESTSSPWVVANVTLRSRPEEPGFPLAWDNVFHGSRSLGFVVATHQTGKDYGSSVWTWYLPLTDGEPAALRKSLLTAGWQEWVDALLADLRPAYRGGIERHVESIDVWKWGHAMVRPTPGRLRGEGLAKQRVPVGRVHFAHTDLSGMALFEEAQHWGVTAADDILRARGMMPRSLG